MTFLFEVTIPYFTGIPRDVVVNTWHANFVDHPPTDSDFDAACTAINGFYENVYFDSGFIRFAPWMNPAGNSIKAYNLADPIPRPIRFQTTMPLAATTPATSSDLPPETAICMSFQAVQIAGVPQARRRGRIFLGGIATGVAAGSDSFFPVVNSTNRVAIAAAAVALKDALNTAGWLWVIYSRAGASSAEAVNGWVDDAPDTQRRRGRAPVVRTLYDLASV